VPGDRQTVVISTVLIHRGHGCLTCASAAVGGFNSQVIACDTQPVVLPLHIPKVPTGRRGECHRWVMTADQLRSSPRWKRVRAQVLAESTVCAICGLAL